MKDILIIEDDLFLQASLKELLEAHGFAVRTAGSAAEGMHHIAGEPPSLILLDLGLPDEDGVSLCRRVRAKWTLPILMLTSRSDAIDKVVGLEVGADDYLTKPFDARELIARIRACLRRSEEYAAEAKKSDRITVGPLVLDLNARVATVNGTKVPLTALEFKLLHYLATNSGRVLQREQLFEEVWGYEEEFNSNSLDVFVYRLRTKLEKAGGQRMIHTARGYGYQLSSEA